MILVVNGRGAYASLLALIEGFLNFVPESGEVFFDSVRFRISPVYGISSVFRSVVKPRPRTSLIFVTVMKASGSMSWIRAVAA